jgi:small subunit ribosomal protein S1
LITAPDFEPGGVEVTQKVDMVGMYKDGSEEEIQDFGAMLDGYYEYDQPDRGDIREAEILLIDDNEIVVDMGGKRDGLVPPQDIERIDPAVLSQLQVGDVVPVYVMNPRDSDGNLIVSINLGMQGHDWTRAEKLLESGEIVEVAVTGFNKGGLLVRFGRLEGFVPVSHALDIPQGLTGPERQDAMVAMVGQVLGLKVIEVNQRRRRLVFSQRDAQREWRSNQKQRLLDELKVGDIVSGRVTGIRDFGVFVDIGGADGLIHVSELAWHRVPHPSDLVKLGDEINVYVLELDQEKQRIALSRCRTLPDPWATVEEVYRVDDIVVGTVNNVVDFGAFVVLDDGIEGLLHVTEMTDGTLVEPYSYVNRGDKLMMRVVRIEREEKRIGFTQIGLGLAHPAESLDGSLPVDTDSVETLSSELDDVPLAEELDEAPSAELDDAAEPELENDAVDTEAVQSGAVEAPPEELPEDGE